ncbi:MAG: hypothetical protein U0P46_12990 [Holophagaceae bacterium]
MTDPQPAAQPDCPARPIEVVVAAPAPAPDVPEAADAYGWGV